jgi:hypothetical protein
MEATETLPAPDLTAQGDDKWQRERQAFYRMLPDLLHSHRGQFVAIHEGQVVESGRDKLQVARRAYDRFGYVPIFVSRIEEQPRPPVRIPSPRLVRDRDQA